MQQYNSPGNPVIRHKYTADPAAIVHQGIVYMYTGHDETPEGQYNYQMHEWCCFSSTDLVSWKEHPVPLRAADFEWVKGGAWASQVIERHGRFYWYVAVEHKTIPGRAIGVAVADKPEGPFKDARGSALVSNNMTKAISSDKDDIDPTVIICKDGQAYLFWGNGRCYYAPLKENMTELDGPIRTIVLPEFSEGAWLHERNGWYYLLYGYQFPEKVAYAMSRSIHGPWEFKGIVNELAGNCQTNSPAVLDYKGETFFIYHNGGLPGGDSFRRSACIDRMHFNEDGTIKRVIMTSEGTGPV